MLFKLNSLPPSTISRLEIYKGHTSTLSDSQRKEKSSALLSIVNIDDVISLLEDNYNDNGDGDNNGDTDNDESCTGNYWW